MRRWSIHKQALTALSEQKVGAAWLCWLVYSNITTEIENMLAPPIEMEEIHKTIDDLTAAAPTTR